MLVLENIASRAPRVKVQQIDLVIDFYFKLSIKSGTRTDRGISSRILFELDDMIAKNFESLLKFLRTRNSKQALTVLSQMKRF